MRLPPFTAPSWLSTVLTFMGIDRDQNQDFGTVWEGPAAKEAKSLENAQGSELRICFRNKTDQTLILCWVDTKGKPYHFYALDPCISNKDETDADDLASDEDHVETTQVGHAFLIVGSPDVDETRRKKSLEGAFYVGAYRAEKTQGAAAGSITDHHGGDEEQEEAEEDDDYNMHMVTITQRTNTECPSAFTNCCQPPAFLRRRRRRVKKDDDDDPAGRNYDDDDDEDYQKYSWKLTVRQASPADMTPVDTTTKCYNGLCLHEEWTVNAEDNWHGNCPELEVTFASDLRTALDCLPAHARQTLSQTTPLWLNRSIKYGPAVCPVTGKGMCFHPEDEWLIKNGMTPAKKHGVELYCSDFYLSDRDLWAPGGVLIHEFSHAYHCICIPDGYDNKEIIDCYKAAMEQGLYQAVPVHGKQGPTAKAYACNNAMEYFAELSTAFLGGIDETVEFNKWFPFNRKQLREHDPRAYELLKKVWKVDCDDENDNNNGNGNAIP